MVESRRMRWAGHITRMGRKGIHIAFLWERQKERDHYEYLEVGGKIILKWILDRMGWYGLDSSG
jgi:hypothetical protein